MLLQFINKDINSVGLNVEIMANYVIALRINAHCTITHPSLDNKK